MINFLEQKKVQGNLFSYPGCKQSYFSIINPFIRKTEKKIYCESFLGSGYVFLNLSKEFEEYHIAEKSRTLLNMFFQLIENKEALDFSNYFSFVNKKFGYVNKYENFYSFREYYNKNIYKQNNLENAFGIIILCNTCINAMFRENENGIGFNACFGSGYINESKVKIIIHAIKHLQSLKNKVKFYDDYKKINIKNSFYFLDPPYYKTNLDYSSNWNENKTIEMIESIDFDNNEYIYSDIENIHGDNKFNSKIKLHNLNGVHRQKIKIYEQVLYYNENLK